MPYALVVEDNREVRDITVHQLGNLGYESIPVGTLEEAIQALSSWDFDLVVLDLILPNGHGIDLVKRMIEARDDVPMVVVTGYPDEREKIAKVAPMIRVLQKPVSQSAMERAVEDSVRSREAVKSLRDSSVRLDKLLKKDSKVYNIERKEDP